jgi:hypothetical protein
MRWRCGVVSQLAVDQLAEQVAARVAAMLAEPAGAGGSDEYGRPEPAAGGRHGARFGGVTETGVDYEQEPGR